MVAAAGSRRDVPRQDLEDLGVAEELRHVDEDIPEEEVNLFPIRAEPIQVGARRRRLGELNAPREPAAEAGLLVAAEVVAGLLLEDLARGPDELVSIGAPQRASIARLRRAGAGGRGGEPLQVGGERDRHLLDEEDAIHAPGGDGAPRHAVEAGGLGPLHQGHPAALLYGLEAQRPVGPGAGEDDAHGVVALLRSERGEEAVDGDPERLGGHREAQPAGGEGERGVGRDQVDVIGLDEHAVRDLGEHHGGVLREDLGEHALVVGREVLHQDERRAGVDGHGVEEPLVRLEPARRGADADDDEGPGGLFLASRERPLLCKILHDADLSGPGSPIGGRWRCQGLGPAS